MLSLSVLGSLRIGQKLNSESHTEMFNACIIAMKVALDADVAIKIYKLLLLQQK